MALDFDCGDDLVMAADFLEPIQLQYDAGGSATIEAALRRAVSPLEAEASGGQLTVADVVWHIPAAALMTVPAPDDRILDGDGLLWTIVAVQRAIGGAKWRCASRRV
jgi:hypothetical protein